MRGDLVENVRRVQSYGIQVQAGMIVGFDHDDATIFEEQLRFIQEARIPVSMTGMLQAMPKTPLYERVEREGRLVAETKGDQFVLSNILPRQMSRRALYEGYRWLAEQLYDFGNYRERTLAFLLNRGTQVAGGRLLRSGDLRRLLSVLRDTVLLGGPRRAWFTLSLLGTTLLRRPSVIKEAVSFAIVHKAFYEYMRELQTLLDGALREFEGASADPDSI
jgi:radical SAM superfamily enzyme YgiQ (UPF0313 family)